jgi:hypothetical protein
VNSQLEKKFANGLKHKGEIQELLKALHKVVSLPVDLMIYHFDVSGILETWKFHRLSSHCGTGYRLTIAIRYLWVRARD